MRTDLTFFIRRWTYMLNEIKFVSIGILQELSKHLTISFTEIF